MGFDRARLPESTAFFEDQGLKLTGPGKWKSTVCPFHGGSDSMRVNVELGAWVCMNCGAKGGDIVSFFMQRNGVEFVDACKALGAWAQSSKPSRSAPLPFSARSALEVVRFEALLCAAAACSLARGIELASADRERLVQAAARIEFIAAEIGR